MVNLNFVCLHLNDSALVEHNRVQAGRQEIHRSVAGKQPVSMIPLTRISISVSLLVP